MIASGGLPNPARLKQLESTHGENLGGEVRRVHDGWQALTIDQKRWLAQNGVTFNKLFTRNAEPLDILKGNLAQHPEGFAFNTAGEMLTRVEAALLWPVRKSCSTAIASLFRAGACRYAKKFRSED